MKIPPPTFSTTPYGDVDTAKLGSLIEEYNTEDLLLQVERLESFMRRFRPIKGIRDDFLRLHRMTHTVVNGAPLCEPHKEDLWELAETLVEELQSAARTCNEIAAVIQPLADLAPHLED